MKQSRAQSRHNSGMTTVPVAVRFAVAFSRTLESLLDALVRRFGELVDRRKPVMQPVPVRVQRDYPR